MSPQKLEKLLIPRANRQEKRRRSVGIERKLVQCSDYRINHSSVLSARTFFIILIRVIRGRPLFFLSGGAGRFKSIVPPLPTRRPSMQLHPERRLLYTLARCIDYWMWSLLVDLLSEIFRHGVLLSMYLWLYASAFLRRSKRGFGMDEGVAAGIRNITVPEETSLTII
jgi:hypothetical protein